MSYDPGQFSVNTGWALYRPSAISDGAAWDYIVVTACSGKQAAYFRDRIEERRGLIPERTKTAVLADEDGERIGSGGATLSVLKWIREREDSFAGLKILVIHSGGDSRRAPQYSLTGKLFSPTFRRLPDGRSSTLFDEIFVALSGVPARMKEGMLAVSGDVLLFFDPTDLSFDGRGAAALSFRADPAVAERHGVYLADPGGHFVRRFLHKQSAKSLRLAGAIGSDGRVDLDTGAVFFGVDVLDALWSLIAQDGVFSGLLWRMRVNPAVRLSLYGDFQFPMAEDATLDGYLCEKPEGEFNPELDEARRAVWEVLHPYRLRLLRFSPGVFLHLGTTRELLAWTQSEASSVPLAGWSRQVNSYCKGPAAAVDSILMSGAEIGAGCLLESAVVSDGARVGEDCVLSSVEIGSGVSVPSHAVVHGMRLGDGRFAVRIWGTDDNPKEDRFFGRPLGEIFDPDLLWDEGEPRILWTAKLYPLSSSMEEAVSRAVRQYDVRENGGAEPGWAGLERISLADGMRLADMNAQTAWQAEIRRRIGTQRLGERVLRGSCGGWQVSREDRIAVPACAVRLPLRVNFGGGWTDTPPYCMDCGGAVLNAAVALDGIRPVLARAAVIGERKIVLSSSCAGRAEFRTAEDFRGGSADAFALHRAVLEVCGVLPEREPERALCALFDRVGGGLLLETDTGRVPVGSGLGTSSILAAAAVRALAGLFGRTVGEGDLVAKVLCAEQRMRTGGGWQDTVGGASDGMKWIRSEPGERQEVRVERIKPHPVFRREMDARFFLIDTGLRRHAGDLVREAAARVTVCDPGTLGALGESKRLAAGMRDAALAGDTDGFAAMMNRQRELNRMIAPGSENARIEAVFEALGDLISGGMLAGAGGGGFAEVILRRGVPVSALEDLLVKRFPGGEIRARRCEILW